MLKVAIEIPYQGTHRGKDEFGARLLMQNLFLKKNIELVRVSIYHFNEKNDSFNEYNIITESGKSKTIKKKYKPDIIRSRSGSGMQYRYHKLKNFITTPSKDISTISNDKYETYLFCKTYQPHTELLEKFFNTTKDNKLGEQIVIKPIRANGGKGIVLTTKEKLLKNKKKYTGLEKLYIVQSFKDFSKGYPGIVKGNHDIRLMFAGKKIIETTLREPKKGGFKSNLGSGGKQSIIKINLIPKELINIAKKIYKNLNPKKTDIFSMDFAYVGKEKKRYLIEINSSPGTRYYQTNKNELKKICNGLIDFFKNTYKNQNDNN